MKLLFVSQTPMAGMPQRTMQVCNRFLTEDNGWARSLIYTPDHYGPRTYKQDLVPNTMECEEALEEADVVILTSYMGEEHARGKPFTRHYSTEPHRWITQRPDPKYSHVVAQYQARFAKHLDLLPNCIPIDDREYIPAEKEKGKINIVYTPTSKAAEGWSNKGYHETMLAFRRLLAQKEIREKINIYVLQNQPHELVMSARRNAHIVIDECSTGSYHTTTLEGLSCGAAVLVNIDEETDEAFKKMVGDKEISLPVVQTRSTEIYGNIRMLVMNPVLLTSMMDWSRKWMQKNYSEKWQAEKWITWHQGFLMNTSGQLTN